MAQFLIIGGAMQLVFFSIRTSLVAQESACQCRRHKFNPYIGKIPWRRKWQPTLVFLPGNSVDGGPGALKSMGSQRVRHGLVTKQQQVFVQMKSPTTSFDRLNDKVCSSILCSTF